MKKIMILAAACMLAGCATHITSSWVKPGTQRPHYNNIVVVALVSGKNSGLAQKMEEEVVRRINKKGYKASSYFDEYGPKAMDKGDEQQALAKLRKKGADAILTIVLLDTAKSQRYIAPVSEMDYYPYYGYYNTFWGYYSYLYDQVYDPGYVTTDTRYYLESNLYTADNEKLVYSVQTQSFDPVSANSLALQYSRLVVDNMAKKKVL